MDTIVKLLILTLVICSCTKEQTNIVDEDIVDEDIVDEDIVDEDIVDEDIVDEDIVDEDIVDEDIVDEDIVDEDIVIYNENINQSIIRDEIDVCIDFKSSGTSVYSDIFDLYSFNLIMEIDSRYENENERIKIIAQNESNRIDIDIYVREIYGENIRRLVNLRVNGSYLVSRINCLGGEYVWIYDETTGELIFEGGNTMCSCTGESCPIKSIVLGEEIYNCRMGDEVDCFGTFSYRDYEYNNATYLGVNKLMIDENLFLYKVDSVGYTSSLCEDGFGTYIGSTTIVNESFVSD